MKPTPSLQVDLGEQLELALDLFGFESKKVGGFFTVTEAAGLSGKPKQRISEAVKDGRLPLVEFTVGPTGRESRLGPYISGESLRRFLSQPRNRGGRSCKNKPIPLPESLGRRKAVTIGTK